MRVLSVTLVALLVASCMPMTRGPDACNSPYNASKLLSGLRKVPGLEQATLRDVTTVPITTFDYNPNIASGDYLFVCHLTIVEANGSTQSGRLAASMNPPAYAFTSDADFQRRSDAFREQAKRNAQTSPEDRQRELLANAARVEFCSNKMSLTVEALSLKNAGFSQGQTVEQLVQRHAYGPGGQVYRGSAGAEATIRSWVSVVYTTNRYVMGMDFRSIYDACMIDGQ